MQTHSEELVELTLVWNRADFRRYFWIVHDRAAVVSSSRNALIPVVGVFLYWFAAHNLAATAAWAGMAVLFLGTPWLSRRKRLRELTAATFGPFTYRFDGEGVHWIGPHSRTIIPWESINAVRVENGFWHIEDVEHVRTYVPDRTMSEADRAALRAVVVRYMTPAAS